MRNLDRAKKKIDKIIAEIGSGKIYSRTLVGKLNKEFKSLKVIFRMKDDKKLKLGKHVVCSGFYNGNMDSEYLYEINISKDPEHKWIKPRRHGFFEEVLLILAHEFRHAYQNRRRNYKRCLSKNPTFKHFNKHVQKDVSYFIEYDELDAYAFETAEAIRELNLPFQTGLQTSSVYSTMYARHVKKYTPKHWKRFVRKVYGHINNKGAIAGK